MLIVFRQPGANIIETVDRISSELPSIKASIPQGIDTTIVLDRTTTIRASVKDVERTLMISICLVIVVVFIFLRNGRATLVPAVAVPVSLIGTFAVMYLCGYSLDNLSLMALTISTGFVVDDAIVVMENITRHLEAGMEPFAAALKGAKEIGFTVLSISISLIAVFIPLLLMGGIVGRLFREFAITLSTAILVSMVISLTTTPMMCAYLLRNEHAAKHGRIYMASERVFERILSWYRHSLHWVLQNAGLTLTALALTIALNVALVLKIPKGFFPQQDTGTLAGAIQGPQDASFAVINDSIKRLQAVINKDPAIQNVIGFTGGQGATNTGNIFITLKPLNERKIGAAEIINRLRPQINRLPVASAYFQAAQDIRIGGRSSAALYQYTIQTDNIPDLVTWGPKVFAEMKKIPGLQDVNSDQQNGGLDILLNYDRVTAAKLGQTAQSLDGGIYSAFGQSEVSIIYTQLNQYYVVLEVDPQFSQTPEGLKNIYFHPTGSSSVTATGNTPLFTMASSQANTIALAINHTGLFPSVTVSFNLAPGVSLSDATLRIDQMKQRLGVPTSVRGFFAGTLQAYQQSLSTEPILVLTALLAVYIVLGDPLREPGAPADDHLDATLRQRRCHARSNALQAGSQRHFHYRNRLADWHSKEERHYDDRFCLASRARREEHRRLHLRSLHVALPPDSHDHDGRIVRRTATGVWNRHRFRTATASGHYHCWWTHHEPASDALHHPGRLSHARSYSASLSWKRARHI